MATGYFSQGQCYASLNQATDAFFQGQNNIVASPVANKVNSYMYQTDGAGVWYLTVYKADLTTNGANLTADYFQVDVNSMPTFNSCEVLDFAQYDINPANVLFVTSWGLGVILLMWSLGYAIGVALKVINKL